MVKIYRSYLLPVIIILLNSICFAQSNETLTITTYYPSPYGVYRNIKLHPSNEPTVGVDRGVMYYDDANNTLRIRNNTGWVNLAAGFGSASSCVTVTCTHPDAFTHTNCTATCPSGYYVTGGAGESFAANPMKTVFEFDRPSGPNGWYCEGNQGGTCYARCCP